MDHQARRSVPSVTICPGMTTRRNTKFNVCDSSAQTKLDDQVKEIEIIIEDFDDTPSVGTARSRPWSIQVRANSICHATSLRILEEFGKIRIPLSHLFLTGFCRRKFVGGCCSETRGWDHRNVQQSCQTRVVTQATAKYQRN